MRSLRRQVKRKSQSQEEFTSKEPKHHKAKDIRCEDDVSSEPVVNVHHYGITIRETDENIIPTNLDETQSSCKNTVSSPFLSAEDEECRPTQPPSSVPAGNLYALNKNCVYDDATNKEKSKNGTLSLIVSSGDDHVKSKNTICFKLSCEDHKIISNSNSFISETDQFRSSKDLVYHHRSFENSNQCNDNSEDESDSVSILGVGTEHSVQESHQATSCISINEKLSLKHIKGQLPVKQIDQQNVIDFGLNALNQQEKNDMDDWMNNESGLVKENKILENYDSSIGMQQNNTYITHVLPNIANTVNGNLHMSEMTEMTVNNNGNEVVHERTSDNMKQNCTWTNQRDTLENSAIPTRISTNENEDSCRGTVRAEKNDDPSMFVSKKSVDKGMNSLNRNMPTIALEESQNSYSATCNEGIVKHGDNINLEVEEEPAPQSTSSSITYHSKKDENVLSGEDKFPEKTGADKSYVSTADIVNDNINKVTSIKETQNSMCQRNASMHYQINGENASPQSGHIQYKNQYSTDRGIQLAPLSYNIGEPAHNSCSSSEHTEMLHLFVETKEKTSCTNFKLTHSLKASTVSNENIPSDKTFEANNEMKTSSQGFDIIHIQKEEERYQNGMNILDQSDRNDTISGGLENHSSQALHDDPMEILSEDIITNILSMSTQQYIKHNNESVRAEGKVDKLSLSIDTDQQLFNERKMTIHNDQTNLKHPDNSSSEIALSNLKPSINDEQLLNDISDSQLCEASHQMETEQKWDQNHQAILSEVTKQKQSGQTYVDSILRDLRYINRQILKFQREMEVLKYKMSSNSTAGPGNLPKGQVSLPRIFPSSFSQNHRTHSSIHFPGKSQCRLKEP